MKPDSLTEALDNLNAAHTVWKLKAELTDEQLSGEVFSDSWLQERWDEADEQIDIANDKLYLANEAARKPEVQTQCLVLEERLKSLQIGIASKIDAVAKELSAENFSSATTISFAEMLADAESQLHETHRNLSKAILSVKGDNIAETIASHETLHRTQEKRILDIQVILAKRVPEPAKEVVKESSVVRSRVEIEKCKVPTFRCVESAQWCPIHLSSSHGLDTCTSKNDSRLICGINGCTKHHHRTLHGSTTTFVLSVNSVGSDDWESHHVKSDVTLLAMQKISTLSGDVNCFFDDGYTCCLILHSTAKRLGLKGERIQCVCVQLVV